MQADFESIATGQLIRPRTFSGLMDLYEQNYLRMQKIAPDLNSADQWISVSPGHLDLYLSVIERCRYTTEIRLTYQIPTKSSVLYDPDMHIKIYHDARIAEVKNRLDRRHHRIQAGSNLLQKWKLNRFLYKWLGYCLYQGHHFYPFKSLKRNAV